jgi:hypothetical protein
MPLLRNGSILLCPSPGSSQFPPGVTCGAAQKSTHKGEDVCTMQAGPNSEAACFAVFDGHGGMLAARRCDEHLVPRLLALAPNFAAAEVEREFWRLDSELGAAGVPDGTTATVLLISRGKAAMPPGVDEASDSVHSTASTVSACSVAMAAAASYSDPATLTCALAHVGDSTAIRVDMCRCAVDSLPCFLCQNAGALIQTHAHAHQLQSTDTPHCADHRSTYSQSRPRFLFLRPLSGSNHGVLILEVTTDHTPKNPGEVARLERHWAVRQALSSNASQTSDRPPSRPPSTRKTLEEGVEGVGATDAAIISAGVAALRAVEGLGTDPARGGCASATDPAVGCVSAAGGTTAAGWSRPHKASGSPANGKGSFSPESSGRYSIDSSGYQSEDDAFVQAAMVFGECVRAARLRPRQVRGGSKGVMGGDEG